MTQWVREASSRLTTTALLAALSFLCIAAAAHSSSADTFYCNQIDTPAYSDCSVHLNTNQYAGNQSYAYHGDGIPVCERATIRYQANNVSRRCGSSPVGSACDLVGYPGGTVFSMYTGNNDFTYVIMDGKAYSPTCV